jgi:hypothetical protein
MNKELLIQTINWLEAGAPERKFNMIKMIEYDDTPPKNWCGTTCCIAGYVWQQSKTPEDIQGGLYVYWDTIEAQAAAMLGLKPAIAHQLFYPSSSDNRSYPGEWEEITPAEAAQAIRNVMAHGEPRWEEILDFDAGDSY